MVSEISLGGFKPDARGAPWSMMQLMLHHPLQWCTGPWVQMMHTNGALIASCSMHTTRVGLETAE